MVANVQQLANPQMTMPQQNAGLNPTAVQQKMLSTKDPRNFDMGGHHTLHTVTDTALKAWAGGGFGGGLGGLGDTIGDVAKGTAGTGDSAIKTAGKPAGGAGGSLLGSFLGGGGGGKKPSKAPTVDNPSLPGKQSDAGGSSFGDLLTNAFNNSSVGKAVNPLLALLQSNPSPVSNLTSSPYDSYYS
jgi:hypothetical protein